MKTTVLILFFCTFGLFANEANSQVMKVSITAKAAPFAQIISDIEKQTDYLFVYEKSEIDVNQKVTINAQNESVAEVLTDVLRNTDVIYAMEGENIMLMKKSAETQQSDTKKVYGTVLDENGDPILGASVAIKGKAIGTTTDGSGKFTLSVSPDDKLIVSYLGYVTQEIAVGNKTNLNINLVENINILDDVVVVGYGTQKKASLTGSVAAVTGEQLASVPTSNLTNALAGKMPGVTVSQSSGGRPGNSSDLVIRSRGTWNNTSPLYVIDGVVRDARAFDVLDASEVESVSILKDAAAASIYGSRASNGVIIVTTKHGKEGKTKISYSGSVGFGSFTQQPKITTSTEQIAFVNDYEREYNVNPNTDNSIPYSEQWGFHFWPTIYKNGKDASGGYISGNVFADDEIAYYQNRNYNLLDEAYRTPITHNHSVNLSGGNDKITYFAGLTYYNQQGAFKSLNYDKYSIRGSIDAQIIKGLKLSASIHTDQSKDLGPNINQYGIGELTGASGNSGPKDDGNRRLSALYYNLTRSSHLFPGKVDGKYVGGGPDMTNESILAFADGATGFTDDKYWNTEYTTSLQYDIPGVKGLSAKLLYNKYIRHRFYKDYSNTYNVYQLKKEGTNSHIITDEILSSKEQHGKPSLSEQNEDNSYYQFNGFLNYGNTFGKHEIGAMIGFEQAESGGEWFNAGKSNYDIINHPYFNIGPTDKNYFSVDGKGWEDGRLSYIGRFNYAFDSRYLIEFSFRRDASVKFDKDHRWGFFPAASAAWRISEEKFIKDTRISDLISNLKLRGSVGLTGNDAIGSWQYMDLISMGGNDDRGAYYGGSTRTYGVRIGNVGNPFITWEKSSNFDFGLELGLWKGMLTFGADYYHRHTFDILGSQENSIPDTFGAKLNDSNYGVVDSWGYEFEIGFNKQINKDVTLWAKGNFSMTDNKIVKWAESEGIPPHLSKIGLNWDRQAGNVTDGIVHSAVKNADGTYDITTSTGRLYKNVRADYLTGRGSGYYINSSNKYAMRPGSVFIVDIGSSTTDADGNKIYNSNPDGIITGDDADQTWIINRYNPPYSFGLLLGGSWKGLSLEVFLQGLAGHQANIATTNGAQYGWAQSAYSFWSGDHFSFVNNPDGKMPAPTNAGGHNMGGNGIEGAASTIWTRDASFVRLKNVTLGYDINKRILSKANISLAKIYVTANNVALLYHPLKEFDPELAAPVNNPLAGTGRPGAGIMSYPLIRTVTFGVNFNF